MEPKEILIDGTPTVIRPMDSNYIIGEDQNKAGVTFEIMCWPGKAVPNQWPNPPVVAYFKKVMDTYGTGAIMAWQGQTLVGFLPFMPLNCGLPEMVFCVCAPIEHTPEHISASTVVPLNELNPKVIKVQCLSVSKRLRRKGIGSAMVIYLIDWAKQQGWEKIQGWAFESSEIDDSYTWLPSIQFWEKSGFERGIARVFDPSDPGTNKPGFDFAINLNDAK